MPSGHIAHQGLLPPCTHHCAHCFPHPSAAHPKISDHLPVQLRSTAPQSFPFLGQWRGVVKSSALTHSISRGVQLPASLPAHPRGYPEPPDSPAHTLPPPALSGFLSVQNRWAQAVLEPPPFPPPDPTERCITGAGSDPLPAAAQRPFRGAGKSLTRLSFSGGSRAAFHSHDKLLLSKLHECSYWKALLSFFLTFLLSAVTRHLSVVSQHLMPT